MKNNRPHDPRACHVRETILTRAFLWRWAAPLLLCVCARAQTPIGELFASDPGASVAAQTAGTGMAVLPGSELAAGIAPATLKLFRGGQVRICPQSQLSVNSGAQGLMLGMNAGAVEINYRVERATADLLVTPDFNIRLAGPGAYHFALGVNAHGDTCFKPLPGNTAGIVFSELVGSDTYGVAADEAASFPEGRLAGRAALSHVCGCAAALPVDRAGEQPASPEGPRVANREVTGAMPTPSQQPAATHVEVETPFVFNARDLPDPVAKLEFSTLPNAFFVQEEADPVVLLFRPSEAPAKEAKSEPAPAPKKEKKGFLARVKAFFGSIFRH